ncbi:winged helix-turn-helix domain-containing protein [Sphingomonas sp. SM33]|uniref:Winged helix-turn-helix domain-containing protein n=1 Tax=Sphingomonas telluris TaxID=2907998 RepID=A0ABS9VRV5_9SPHN|nr:winged helix-turn-helix domain-containing protein [Sphingomonas telluris]MCH8617479.1 winged helix-turn-helix domain-containing protein [Sphingomonas telluris]
MTQQSVASGNERIDLARSRDFDLGAAHVRPSLLEIRFGGRTEVVEPRVMQLLVALVRAGGAPVSRDELIETCWGGLIVSDDAVNQSVSKLRRAVAGIQGVTVTSVPRVGYRIVKPASALVEASRPPTLAGARRAVTLSAILAVASILAFDTRSQADATAQSPSLVRSRSGQADRLHATAVGLFRERSRPAYAEAETLLRQAVAADPKHAPSWARLSMVVWAPWWWAAEKDPQARIRLRSEAIGYARRALALDPRLAEGHQALGFVLWNAQGLRYLERAAVLDPNDAEIRQQLADLLEDQLELRRALAEAQRGLELEPTSARGMQTTAALLGRLGHQDDAEAVIDRLERMTRRASDARRARYMLSISQGKLADAAGQCSRSLVLGDDPWGPQACLVEIAAALHNQGIVDRLLRAQPKLADILAYKEPGYSVRLAQNRPSDWWADVFVGALARQLVARGNDRLLLSLYDDRYESADQLWAEQHDRADMVAPSLILAMKRSGRTDEAATLRAHWLADIRKMQVEGDNYFRVPVWSAQMAALDGDSAEAARWLNAAVSAGWKGYGDDVLAFEPDRDPVFALVRDSLEMRRAIARFKAAAAKEAEALKQLKLTSANWPKRIS